MAKAVKTRAIIQSMITLAGGALGLVCAVAWNAAMKSTMKTMLGEDHSLAGLYNYAILATLVAVFVPIVLALAAARVGGEAAISREAEG